MASSNLVILLNARKIRTEDSRCECQGHVIHVVYSVGQKIAP